MSIVSKKNVPVPYSLELEKSLLCCFLIDPSIVEIICEKLIPDHFFVERHKTIFKAIQELYNNGKPVDLVTVNDQLEMTKKAEVDIFDYLYYLTNFIPSSANYVYYYNQIHSCYLLRQFINACEEGIRGAHNKEDISILINNFNQEISKIEDFNKTSTSHHLSYHVDNIINELNTQKPDKSNVLLTEFENLDNAINGFRKGDLIVLAARPSVGKTSFALQIAYNILLKKDTSSNAKVGAFFSIEMNGQILSKRIISANYDVPMKDLINSAVQSCDQAKLWGATLQLKRSRFYVDDSETQTPASIKFKCQQIKRERGQIDLIIIDYLQLLQTNVNSQYKGNKVLEVAEITRQLKMLAKAFDCPVLLLSQLSRNIETRDLKDKEPKLSDLRDSGAIEQDADMVLFLSRNENKKSKGNIILSIAKNRNGPLANVKFNWIGEYVKFVECDENT
ncbi:MAG: replicative DNA helicase [Christensenellaceae bacterium]|jgi:replicative DNA helicase|nr:replicative DNA helicase [Christensenellaceae bacterium]